MKGWRTILVNVAIMVAAVCDYMLAHGGLFLSTVIKSPLTLLAFIIGINALGMAMRVITTTRLGSKE